MGSVFWPWGLSHPFFAKHRHHVASPQYSQHHWGGLLIGSLLALGSLTLEFLWDLGKTYGLSRHFFVKHKHHENQRDLEETISLLNTNIASF
jgi:hypothetical protein